MTTSATAAAISGLAASTAELDASASNVANAQSVGQLSGSGWGPATAVGSAQAYQPVAALQYAAAGGGVATRFAPVSPATRPAYDPQSPDADAEGLVAAPNVDPVQERVNQIEALNAYKANVTVLEVSDQMQQSLLAIV
jgi:flagellar basal-body rod protein FlgC